MRDKEVNKMVDVACQFVVQNTRTDSQVKHQPKANEGFKETLKTPLSAKQRKISCTTHGKAKSGLKNSLKTDCCHLPSTRYGMLKKAETEDLLKLDGEN